MEYFIFILTISCFFIAYFFPRFLLLVAISVFPFYKIIGTILILEAEISAFDGLIMILFVTTVLKLPIIFQKKNVIFLDVAIIVWVFVNLLLFSLNRFDFIYGLNTFRNFVAIPIALYFLIRFYVTDIKMMKRLLWIVVISTSIMSILGVVEFLQTYVRIKTVMNAGHAGSIIMAMGMFSGIYLFVEEDRVRLKFLLGTSILLNFTGVLLVFGRIMIPSVVLIPFIISFILRKRPSLLVVFAILFLITGLAAPLQVRMDDEAIKAFQRQQRLGIDPKQATRMIDAELTKAALGVRVLPYYTSLEYIAKKPILGYGYSVHKLLIERQGFPLAHSHNIGLDILLRTGLVGLIAFIWLLLIFVKYVSCRKLQLSEISGVEGVFISLVFIILTNSFANSMANLAACSSFWLSIAIAVSFKTISYEKKMKTS